MRIQYVSILCLCSHYFFTFVCIYTHKCNSSAPLILPGKPRNQIARQVPYRKIIFFDLDIIATWLTLLGKFVPKFAELE